MDFALTEAQAEIYRQVLALARGFGWEYWREKDRKAEYPTEFVRAFADAGWLGLALPISDGRARKVLVQWTILLVLVSLVPRVSWAAHLGGFVAGLVCGLVIRAGYRTHPAQAFRTFDRLALPFLVLAALAVVLVMRMHAGAGLDMTPGAFGVGPGSRPA